MINIATQNLCKDDLPMGIFNWSRFSEFALTFDPISETIDELNHVPVSATPFDKWSVLTLRYFLYCWQRIGNNQGGLPTDAIDKVQTALTILRAKI